MNIDSNPLIYIVVVVDLQVWAVEGFQRLTRGRFQGIDWPRIVAKPDPSPQPHNSARRNQSTCDQKLQTRLHPASVLKSCASLSHLITSAGGVRSCQSLSNSLLPSTPSTLSTPRAPRCALARRSSTKRTGDDCTSIMNAIII
jgi:hypothetical protein